MKLIFFNFKNRVKKAWQVWVIVFKAIADLFFFHALLFAVCSILAVLIYKFILGSNIISILSNLQNLSAALFTMASIWVAYSYPQAIAVYTKPTDLAVVNKVDSERIKVLVKVIITSACVLIGILLFNWAKAIFTGMEIYDEYHVQMKILGISFLLYLSLLQIASVFSIIGASIEFVNDLVYKEAEAEANKRL